LRVVVVGALSAIKGSDILEAVASEAAATAAPLEFHLVGYPYRVTKTLPHANLTIHGAYAEKDLPAILDRLKPDVVWFPALWPETYSYTLSTCLAQGVPVVAPDLGAFSERLDGRRWTWLHPWNTSPTDWFQLFLDIRQDNFMTGVEPEPPSAATPSGADALIQTWSYEHDYLHDLPAALPAPTVSPEFVSNHQPGREVIVAQ
jgi:glycosyltransferase involved in cell wall biosynthesis